VTSEVAPTLSARTRGGGGLGTDFDCDGGLVAFGGNNTSGAVEVATARNGHSGPHGRLDFETETFVVAALAVRTREGVPQLEVGEDIANALMTPNGGRAGVGVGAVWIPEVADPITAHEAKTWSHEGAKNFRMRNAIAFDTTQITSPTNRCQPADAAPPAVAWTFSRHANGMAWEDEVAPTLDNNARAGNQQHGVRAGLAVRRLTPRECERLQGFEDDYTLITWKGRPARDGPRYRALGNSMAVPVMRWIGQRIAMVEALGPEAAQ